MVSKIEVPACRVKVAYAQRMAAARDAFTNKQFDVALQQATAAWQLVPNDVEATRIIIASREALKPVPKVEPKVEPKKELPKVEPKKEAPKVDLVQQVTQLLQSAAALEGQSKYAEAQAVYEQTVKLNPNDALLRKRLDFVKIMAAFEAAFSSIVRI